MPHVSKDKISPKVAREMNRLFANVAGLKQGNSILIQDLLTSTEKIMLAKRLAAIYMLSKKISSYKISLSLKISSSTMARLQRDLETGRFILIENFAKAKKTNDEKIKNILKFFLAGNMRSYSGKNRWNWLDDLFNEK